MEGDEDRPEPPPARSFRAPGASRDLSGLVRKVSDFAALEIVRDIVEQDLKEGQKLPVEAKMLGEYGVSRSSLREALRLLEYLGLISIRRGAGVGAVVGQVRPKNLARIMTMYLHMLGVDYNTVLDAWQTADWLLARLAAANPDREARVKAMTPFLDESHSWKPTEGTEFHDTVAELAGNAVLGLLLRSVGAIIGGQVSPRNGELERHLVHDHRAIAEAIIEGDSDKAGELMLEHVQHVVEDFKAYWPQKVGERVEST